MSKIRKDVNRKLSYPNKNVFLNPSINVIMICFISLFLIEETGADCSKVTNYVLSSEECSTTIDGINHCSLTSSITLTAAPLGLRSCFLMKDHKNNVIATIKIKTTGLKLKCKKNIKYYIPKPKLWCNSMSSCRLTHDWCEGDYHSCNHPEEKIPELWGGDARGKFWAGCDQVGISGCGIPIFSAGVPGCWQYLVRITNEMKETYEVFDCPEWVYELEVLIEEIQGLEIVESNFKLSPGVSRINKDYVITLTSASSPPSSLLNSCFIKKHNVISYTECNKVGELTPGIVGDIQCANEEFALTGLENCIMDENIFKKTRKDDSIYCESKYINPENAFDKILPIQLFDYNFEKDEQGIPFTTVINNALFTYQIDTKNYKISHKSDNNKCFVEFIEAKGCYSCVLGAIITLNVKTNFGEANGLLECEDLSLIAPIMINTTKSIVNVTLIYDKSIINAYCHLKCPDSDEKFKITGSLIYIPPDDKRSNDTHLSDTISKSFQFDWDSLWSNPFASLFEFLIGLCITIFFVAIIFFIVKYFLFQFISKKSKKS